MTHILKTKVTRCQSRDFTVDQTAPVIGRATRLGPSRTQKRVYARFVYLLRLVKDTERGKEHRRSATRVQTSCSVSGIWCRSEVLTEGFYFTIASVNVHFVAALSAFVSKILRLCYRSVCCVSLECVGARGKKSLSEQVGKTSYRCFTVRLTSVGLKQLLDLSVHRSSNQPYRTYVILITWRLTYGTVSPSVQGFSCFCS